MVIDRVERKFRFAMGAVVLLAHVAGCGSFSTADTDQLSSAAEACEEPARLIPGSGWSEPSVSADGTLVAYTGKLRWEDDETWPVHPELYLMNVDTRYIWRGFNDPEPIRRASTMSRALISGNGRYVAVRGSRASSPTDPARGGLLYRLDRETDEMRQLTGDRAFLADFAISYDGNHVAFTMDPEPDPNGGYYPNLYLYSADTGETKLIVDIQKKFENYIAPNFSFSRGGRYLGFSTKMPLSPLHQNTYDQGYTYDLATGEFDIVSVNAQGEPANNQVTVSDMDDSGRYVVMYSFATNLSPLDEDCRGDIYVRDRELGTMRRVNSDIGNPLYYDSFANITGDGRWLVFTSSSYDAPESSYDIFVHDLSTGRQRRVEVGRTGHAGPLGSLSADGRVYAYTVQEGSEFSSHTKIICYPE